MANVKYGYRPKNQMARMLFAIGLTALILEIIIVVHLALTNSFSLLNDAMSYVMKALTCNFVGLEMDITSILVISSSVIFYFGILVALFVLILAIFKSRYKAIIGSVSALLVAVLSIFDLSIISTYLFSNIAGAGIISVIFLVFFAVLLIMLGISIYLSFKYCLLISYNWETNFVFDEKAPKTSDLLDNAIYQEVDKEMVGIINVNDNSKEENSIVDTEQVQDVASKQEQVVVEQQETPVEVEKEEVEEEFDEELSHLEDEMEEDEDDNLEDPDNEETQTEDSGFPKIIRKNLTFAQKIRRSNAKTRENYKTIRKYFESLGFKSKVTKTGNSFLYKNTKYAVISVSGKSSMKIYFKLNYSDYENSPIPLKNVSDIKKYEKTPTMLMVKSDLSVKRAKRLIDDIKNKLS